MVQNADRKSVIKPPFQRQTVDVGLNNVNVGQVLSVSVRGLDSHAQVYPDHVARAPLTDEPGVTAFAASAFEHDLVAYEIPRDGRDPIQELFLVVLLDSIEDQPLRAEIFSRFALCFVVVKVGEPGDAEADREG